MMQNEKTITFDKLPEAVGYLTEQVIELKKMVSELKPSSSEKRVLIEIEDACRIIHKAKATIYTLVRKDTDGKLGACQLHTHVNGLVHHQHWVNRFLFHNPKD